MAAPDALQCPACTAPLASERDLQACPACGFALTVGDGRFAYDYQSILRRRYPKQWFRNQVLQANGIVGYARLAQTSLSVAGRDDVAQFRNFIEKHHRAGRILDVGCGPLALPGYLEGIGAQGRTDLFGLDPEDSDFAGHFTKGAMECSPYRDGSFSTVVFATSVDHVCDLPSTIVETRRVLEGGGRALLWTGAIEAPTIRERLRNRVRRIRVAARNVRELGWQARNAVIYPEGTVFLRPRWATDPFHLEHLPHREYARLFVDAGFALIDLQEPVAGSVFIALEKRGDA